jgi:hypothetical protein
MLILVSLRRNAFLFTLQVRRNYNISYNEIDEMNQI